MPRDRTTSAPSAPPREVALLCASLGWPVHPLAPRRKDPAGNCPQCRPGAHSPQDCSCSAQGRWCHSFHAATTDPNLIRTWWSANPRFGVGISCGPAGLVVIDVDAHGAQVPDRDRLLPGIPIHPEVDLTGLASGYDTIALLAALREQPDPTQDSTTLRIPTPSGGLHIWYATEAHHPAFNSSTGSGAKTALAWQVDVRAAKGYIVAPFTVTDAGTYTPVDPTVRPAPLPLWLADELIRTGHTPRPAQQVPHQSVPRRSDHTAHTPAAARTLATVLDDIRACERIPEGAAFTERLNRAAFTVGGLVGSGHLSDADARAALQEAADRARPHQSGRNAQIISSALTAGASRPLHLKGSRA